MTIAHGACTRAPYGECTTTRQSPSSSRNRSTTSVVSDGTSPVAVALLGQVGEQVVGRPRRPGRRPRRARGRRRRPARPARGPRRPSRGRARRAGRGRRPSRTAAGRARPGAGVTSTRSGVMSSMRHVLEPEREHVADARLVDHLLVELADALAAAHRAARALGVDRARRWSSRCRPGRRRTARGPGWSRRWSPPAAARPGRPLSTSAHPVPHEPRPQLGELLARVPAREHVEHRAQRRLARARRTAPRGGRRPTSSSSDQSSTATIATICCASTSSGLRGTRSASSVAVAHPLRPSRPPATSSPRNVGNTTPRDTAPTWCPARPTRCSPLATDGGDPTCTTRSMAPMSMPSSSELVATTAGSSPALSSDSVRVRSARLIEPWCARARMVAASRVSMPTAVPDCAGTGAARQRRRVGHVLARPLRPDLVHPRGQPLGAAPGVGEHERRAVRRRPGRRRAPRRAARSTAAASGAGRGAGQVELVGRRRRRRAGPTGPAPGRRRRPRSSWSTAAARRRPAARRSSRRAGAAQELRDRLDRPHRRRQPDPLRRSGAAGAVEQRVEPLEREGEVRAALGRRRPRGSRRRSPCGPRRARRARPT